MRKTAREERFGRHLPVLDAVLELAERASKKVL